MTASASRAWWVAVLVAATAGCLPEGPPPAGRQILADRGASLAGLVPPNGDGLLRILLLRPGATSDSADLSVVSLDPTNEPSPERPLISDVVLDFGVGCGVSGPAPCGVRTSATIQVHRTDGSFAAVNAITGDVEPQDVGAMFRWYTTPGGRSFQTGDSGMGGTLIDADGHTTPIALARTSSFSSIPYGFIGEDFVYLDPQQNVVDLPPSDVPQQLATGVLQFTRSATPDRPALILTRVTSSSVLDITSGTETMLPFQGSTAQFSADGRWVLDTEGEGTGTYTFFDFRAGVEQTVQIDARPISHIWRPGTSELWVTAGGDTNDTYATWVVRPDAPALVVPGAYLEYVYTGGPAQPFQQDGAYWFFTTTSLDSAAQVIQVGQSDDPAGPAFPLNPPSTFLALALPLANGRMLTTAYAKDQNRSDVALVDPLTGQTDVVARRGLLLTSGATRAMGLFHVLDGRGDLTIIDLDAEQTTVLAPEFASSAAAEPRGGDALAPGARVVYQFQARTASPYDGIWVTTAP
ncbi:MAG TPA: hypothetical protein VN962_00580 [Polyangia bacterium]|nr:hypothetical protein [Polyangia bacterium]